MVIGGSCRPAAMPRDMRIRMRRNSNRTFRHARPMAISSRRRLTAPSNRLSGLSAVPIRAATRAASTQALRLRPVMPARKPCSNLLMARGRFERPYQEPDLGHGDWPPQQEIGGFGQDPYSQQGGAELGFAQPENGELDPAYGEEDADYEDDYAPRGRRPLMIAAALIGAILIGGGMAYGYKKLAVSGGSQGEPPVIKSEAAPSKTKPADAGGKQFPYSDTKIMGRLGDGTSPAAAAEAPASASAAADAPSADSASDSTDEGGARKVATLVVGRDGSIQPPPAEPVSDSPPTAGAACPAPPSSMSSAPIEGRGTPADHPPRRPGMITNPPRQDL